jgi:hypothetical protein
MIDTLSWMMTDEEAYCATATIDIQAAHASVSVSVTDRGLIPSHQLPCQFFPNP